MAEPKYIIAGGEPTAKWKASAKAGLGGGTGLALVIGYLLARLDPNMPQEVLLTFATLLASWLTSGAMMIAGFLARPVAKDRPVLESTPPPAGIPPA